MDPPYMNIGTKRARKKRVPIKDTRRRGNDREGGSSYPDTRRGRGLEVITVHVSDARDVGIVHMPLQGIPPSEGPLTTPDHQSAPNHIRPSPDTLLVRHALLNTRVIQVGPGNTNPAARPPLWFPPTIMSFDMTLEIGYAKVLPGTATSSDGAVRVKFLIDEQGAVFGLEVARGSAASVGVQASVSTSRRDAPL